MIGKSDSESMIHERKKQLDKISLRELLTELYHGLNVTVVNKNDSIISTQIHECFLIGIFYKLCTINVLYEIPKFVTTI